MTKPIHAKTSGPQVMLKIEMIMMDILERLNHYPKNEKYTLGERTELKLLDGVEAVHYATFNPEVRLQKLRAARTHFELVLMLLRVARRKSFISEGYYKKISEDFDEIGKMISSWIKTVSVKNQTNQSTVLKTPIHNGNPIG